MELEKVSFLCKFVERKANMNDYRRNFQDPIVCQNRLAKLYSPNNEVAATLQTLYRWMRRNNFLMTELESVGYNKFRHCFLKQEVEIIVKFQRKP